MFEIPSGSSSSTAPLDPVSASSRERIRGGGAGALLYAVAIFLSAFLLFAVQPLLARFILPWFGGAASVWTTCLLFFQTLLLAGYAYAHLSARGLSARAGSLAHVALLAGCLLALPITPSAAWQPEAGTTNPTARILLLLTATIGLPYFALSATGPLLQHWFARQHPTRSPYRLYALSNVGSLLALWSYPFLFEPLLTRRWQSWGWSLVFVAFAITCAWCAINQLRLRGRRLEPDFHAAPVPIAPESGDHGALTGARSLLVLLMAASASALLLACTNTICQEIAPMPFLWVLPLSLYLLTFILCFEYPRLYRRSWVMPAAALSSFAIFAVIAYRSIAPLWAQVGAYCTALFLLCMFCHGEIARLRPRTSELTRYYLLVSLGGVVGAVFVSLAAPIIFSRYLEFYVIVLVLWMAGLGVLLLSPSSPLRHFRRPLVWTLPLAGLAALALLYWSALEQPEKRVLTRRNFYGVLEVLENDDGNPQHTHRSLMHNGTIHGVQFTHPMYRGMPTAYYARPGGGGLALSEFRPDQTRHVGIVGLGAGGLASFARPGERFQFYELDPDVADIARSAFTFLADCRGEVRITLGDARLSMSRQPPQQFDVLVLDAFSGDAIPVHLLTREAFELYLRHLKPDGLIAIHISNKHLDLLPPTSAVTRHFGLAATVFRTDAKLTPYLSIWVLATKDVAFLKSLRNQPSAQRVRMRTMAPWNDEHAPLFPLLR